MNYLTYAVYIILPIVLLWKAKPHSIIGEWNEEFLSLEQTKAFQGFLTVCIMLHHIGQKTCASWIWPPERIIHGLDPFVPAGYVMVSFFLFFNGYGLYKSYRTKPDYLKGFFRKRILPILLCMYLTGFIFFIARIALGEKMDLKTALLYLLNIKLCNPNSWYVIVLPFFYAAFYLSFRFIKKDWIATATTCMFVIFYMLFSTTVDHNDYWIRGEWWYNSVFLFPVGIMFAKYENKIIPHLKKWYPYYLTLALPLFVIICSTAHSWLIIYSYYGEYWGAPDVVQRRCMCLCIQSLLCVVFVFICLLLGLKIKIGNKFLRFMGEITLEFYMIHGLFVELFTYKFDETLPTPYTFTNVPLYIITVFILGVPSAYLLRTAIKKICPQNK